MISGWLINTDGFNWTTELLKVLNLNSEVVLGSIHSHTTTHTVCGWMIPLTATSADDASRLDGHSEDCVVFMSNAQSLVFLLLFIAFNLLLFNLLHTLVTKVAKLLQICDHCIGVANSVSMCAILLQQLTLHACL
jgi:hypothetical protein